MKEKILQKNYDIVLLDLIMPDIDGLNILESSKPHKPDTEFIMITAVDDLQTAVKAVKMGAYDYLIKPVEPERLLLVINRAFERKGLLTSLFQSSTNAESKSINSVFPEFLLLSSSLSSVFLDTTSL